MRAPARLGLYALTLGVAFTATFGVARAVVPAAVVDGWVAPQGEHSEEGNAGHGGAGDEGGHGSPGAPAPAGQQVPGLSVEQDGYRLTHLSAPGEVGSDGRLGFTLVGPDGEPVSGYEISHDKELHLVVVRSDGAGFRHVHPETDGQGGWSIDWRWDQAGSMRVYADFVPADSGEQVTLTSTVDVAGELTPVTGRPDSRPDEVAGYSVALDGDLQGGSASELAFTVTRDGEPVTTLQPYLGAYGHLVALRDGDLGYLHVHPLGAEPAGEATSGPGVSFMAEVPSPGRYLLYLDLRIHGQVHTAEFVLTAR